MNNNKILETIESYVDWFNRQESDPTRFNDDSDWLDLIERYGELIASEYGDDHSKFDRFMKNSNIEKIECYSVYSSDIVIAINKFAKEHKMEEIG